MSNPNGRATMPDRQPRSAVPADPLDDVPFDPATGGRAAWDAAATAVLRKAGRLPADAAGVGAAADLLTRTTLDGVPVPALGTPALVADLPPAGEPGTAPFLRGSRAADGTGWDVRALVAEPDPARANAAALSDLTNGATSLWVWVGPGGSPAGDLARVLDGVLIDIAPVVVQAAGIGAVEAAQALCAVLDAAAEGVVPAVGTSLGADPLGALLRADASGDAAGVARDVTVLAESARTRGVGAFVVDGTIPHEAGAAEIDELAWTLAVGVAYLRTLTEAGRSSAEDAAALIDFRYAATAEQFVTLAKLRAARLLWHRVCELSGVTGPASAQCQHAVTSRAMTTRWDPWTNLLRTTVAAFAAGAGGATAVTVLPFDAAIGLPDDLGRRMARNISGLLLEESHIGRVADPAGGAHAVEALTADLAQRAWQRFGELDDAGGPLAVLADGSFAQSLADTATRRDRQLASRRRPVTGVSEFPLAGEEPLSRRPWPEAAGWAGIGWAEPFEAMRDAPAPRPVLLVTLGDPGGFGPRLTFVGNLLTAGGVSVLPSGPVLGADDATAAAGEAVAAGGTVAMVLGPDPTYEGIGADVVLALRDAGITDVLLAGRVPAALAGRVDDAVAVGDDVLDFLHRTRRRLGCADPADREVVST